MNKTLLALFFAATFVSANGPNDLEKMPATLETDFALSALRPNLRAGATVLLLDPKVGYVKSAVNGTNGWTCIVERTEWRHPEYRNDVYVPLCYDRQGSDNQLKVWLDVATMRARGVPAAQVREEIQKRFESGVYPAPTKPGFSYMIAPMMRTYMDPTKNDVMTMSMPHVMYYGAGLTNADIGGTFPPGPYPFVFEDGPHQYLIQLLGDKERADVVAQNADLVKRLCDYDRHLLCLAPHDHP